MDGYFVAIVVNNAPTKEDQKERPGVWVEVRPVWGPNAKNTIKARVLQPLASDGHGAVVLPEKDDEVLVLGGTGDGLEPVVIGSLYTEKRKPPTLQGKKDEVVPTVRGLVTKSGMEITVDDTAGKESILLRVRGDKDGTATKDLVSVTFAKKEGTLTVVAQVAMIDVKKGALKVQVHEGDVSIVAKKGKVVVDAKGDAVVKSGGNVTVEGKMIAIKGNSVTIA